MSLVVHVCDSPCYSGEDVSGGELSNAESSDSFEGQHVSIKLLPIIINLPYVCSDWLKRCALSVSRFTINFCKVNFKFLL